MDVSAGLVRRLLAAQFPRWAGLPLAPPGPAGWDNVIYRLGEDLAVRLPRRALGAAREHHWLPRLAPHLPLPVLVPLGKGVPGEGYPWPWSVCRWLPGEIAAAEPVADPEHAAAALAGFVAALRAVAPAGGPDSEFRGVPLAARDADVRTAVAALRGVLDPAPVLAAWQAAVAAPPWRGPGVWMHGDLHPANLLVDRGRLSAVLDFGLVAVGDPACDVMVVWTFLPASARERFRAALAAGEAAWARARGWALDFGLMCAARASGDLVLGGIGRRTVDEVVADQPMY
jgi:aminoglycoside phosphotransferase (APT) family kinase protein